MVSKLTTILVFPFNYDLKYLNLSTKVPTLYKDIISHWQELNKVVPTTKKDVLDQIVWNNRFITINKASVYFRNWHHAGILLYFFYFLYLFFYFFIFRDKNKDKEKKKIMPVFINFPVSSMSTTINFCLSTNSHKNVR